MTCFAAALGGGLLPSPGLLHVGEEAVVRQAPSSPIAIVRGNTKLPSPFLPPLFPGAHVAHPEFITCLFAASCVGCGAGALGRGEPSSLQLTLCSG